MDQQFNVAGMQQWGNSMLSQNAIMSTLTGYLGTIEGFDNPAMRSIITILCVTALPQLTSGIIRLLQNCTSWMIDKGKFLGYFVLFRSTRRLYYAMFGQQEVIHHRCVVPQISQDRQPSELYEALSWYVNTRPRPKEEEVEFEYFLPKDINSRDRYMGSPDRRKPMMAMPPSTKSEFKYRDTTMTYSIETKVEEIHTDKTRKRENRKIALSYQALAGEEEHLYDSFFMEVMKEWADSKKAEKWKQKTFLNRGSEWEEIRNNNYRTLRSVVLKKEQKEKLEKVLNNFEKRSEWYKEVGIPRKVSFLMHGEPGTGKTTIIQSVSRSMERNIYYCNLSKVQDDDQLIALFEKINYKEAVIVMEEIDTATQVVLDRKLREVRRQELLEKRRRQELERKEQGLKGVDPTELGGEENASGVTLGGLLEIFQGVFDTDGRMLFMTTNHRKMLDKALIREGRVDYELELTACDIFQVLGMFELYYQRELSKEETATIRAIWDERDEEHSLTPAALSTLLIDHHDDVRDGMDALKGFFSGEVEIFHEEESFAKLENDSFEPTLTKALTPPSNESKLPGEVPPTIRIEEVNPADSFTIAADFNPKGDLPVMTKKTASTEAILEEQ